MNTMKKGAVLIDSYRRVRAEQQAAMARLKDARGSLSSIELKELEEIIYFPYDEVINKIEIEIGFLCEGYIPIYRDFLAHVEGISVYDSLQLITFVKDIKRFENVSKFWKYSGFAPVQYCKKCGRKIRFIGECSCGSNEICVRSDKRVKGVIPNYNENLKKHLVSIGNKLIKRDGYYKEKFFEYRDSEFQKNPRLSNLHIENRAKRKTIKLFLYHLFTAWYLIEGIKPPKPYSSLPRYEYVWEKEDYGEK